MDIAHLVLTLGYKRNPHRVPYNSVLLHFYLTANEKCINLKKKIFLDLAIAFLFFIENLFEVCKLYWLKNWKKL